MIYASKIASIFMFSSLFFASSNSFAVSEAENPAEIRNDTDMSRTDVNAISARTGVRADSADSRVFSPTEELMSEHGMVDRILLIFESSAAQLMARKAINIPALAKASNILQKNTFDHHIVFEEKAIFPRVMQAGRDVNLIKTLIQQHRTAEKLNADILRLCNLESMRTNDRNREALAKTLTSMVQALRTHTAFEETHVFKNFKKITSAEEFTRAGQEYRNSEVQVFGANAFERTLAQLAEIEIILGVPGLTRTVTAVRP